MSLEDAIGLGFTVALTDHFVSGASAVAASMRALETQATGSSAAIDSALHGMETGMKAFGAGAALGAALIGLGSHAVSETLKVEGLRRSVTALAGDSGQLAEQLELAAGKSGVFTGEQFQGAAKQLLGLGVNAKQLPGILSAGAEAAAVLGTSIDDVTQSFAGIRFGLENGMPITRQLKGLGISLSDLTAQGIRESKGKITSSMDDVMGAIENSLHQRFGARAGEISGGVTALRTQIGAAITKGYVAAGNAGLVDAQKSILRGILDVVQAGAPALGEAFGSGLSFVLTLLSPIGRGIKAIGMAVAEFATNHPGIIRIAVALAGIAAAALVVVGAVAALGGAIKIIPLAFSLASSALGAGLKAGLASLGAALPMMLAIAAVSYLVYRAWTTNFGGIRDTLTRWYDSAALVVEGLWALFSTSENGVGAIPAEVQKKLMDRGLWPLVQTLFIWGERIKDVVVGAWKGLVATFDTAWKIVQPVGKAIGWVLDKVGALGPAINDTSLGTAGASAGFEKFGKVLGVVAGVLGIVAIAQWAVNIAMLLNPVGLLVLGVVALALWGLELAASWDKVTYSLKVAWLYMQKIAEWATGVKIDTSALEAAVDKQKAELVARIAAGRENTFDRVTDFFQEAAKPGAPGVAGESGASGAQVQPTPGSPSITERLFGLPQPTQSVTPAGTTQQKIELHNHLYLDDKEIHSSVVSRDGEVQSLDGGAT